MYINLILIFKSIEKFHLISKSKSNIESFTFDVAEITKLLADILNCSRRTKVRQRDRCIAHALETGLRKGYIPTLGNFTQ